MVEVTSQKHLDQPVIILEMVVVVDEVGEAMVVEAEEEEVVGEEDLVDVEEVLVEDREIKMISQEQTYINQNGTWAALWPLRKISTKNIQMFQHDNRYFLNQHKLTNYKYQFKYLKMNIHCKLQPLIETANQK